MDRRCTPAATGGNTWGVFPSDHATGASCAGAGPSGQQFERRQCGAGTLGNTGPARSGAVRQRGVGAAAADHCRRGGCGIRLGGIALGSDSPDRCQGGDRVRAVQRTVATFAAGPVFPAIPIRPTGGVQSRRPAASDRHSQGPRRDPPGVAGGLHAGSCRLAAGAANDHVR